MGGVMTKNEIARMNALERRIREIAEEEGLTTTDIIFEVVSARRMIEAMAYHFPTNYAHWTFGRDYDRIRTIYEETGAGIPYEVVWNFHVPKAFLVADNPFALNVLTIAHVYGHVDHFLRSIYFKHGRSFADVADEARFAADKFREYENIYGKEEVERLIDAAMAIQWHQHPDPFHEEQDEENLRAFLIGQEQERIKAYRNLPLHTRKRYQKKLEAAESRLKELRHRTPPQPTYDILKYIIDRAPRLDDWERHVLTLFRNQARVLAPNMRVKLLAEGWATKCHKMIMRRLFDEGLLTAEEHGVYVAFHRRVTQASKANLNVYCVGPALYEYIEVLYNKGRFGKEYETCTDPLKKERWDTGAMKGKEKIFEVSAQYSDRKAVEDFFTDEFIRDIELYLYTAEQDETGEITYKIATKDPAVIRHVFKSAFTLYDIPTISVQNGNYNDHGELYLRHHYDKHAKRELLPHYRDGAIAQIGYLWRRPVHIETVIDEKPKLFSYDGKRMSDKQLLIFPGQ